MVRDRRDRLIDRSTITIERDIFDTSMQTTDRRTISPRMTMWFSSTGEDESTELDLYPMSKESERFLREEGSELKKKEKKSLFFPWRWFQREFPSIIVPHSGVFAFVGVA